MSLRKKFEEYVLRRRPTRRVLSFAWCTIGLPVCYYLAYLVRFDFSIPEEHLQGWRESVLLVFGAHIVCVAVFRLYRGLWSFFAFRDCLRSASAFAVAAVLSFLVVYLANGRDFEGIPRSTFLINYFIVLAWEVGGRAALRIVRERSACADRGADAFKHRVLLVGEPDEADLVIRSIARQGGGIGHIIGVLTNEGGSAYGTMHGVCVHGNLLNAGTLIREKSITKLIFLPPFTAPKIIRQVLDSALEVSVSCEYSVVPSLDDITSGKIGVDNIRRVEVEDLLERAPHDLDLERLRAGIEGKRIMITGAGGSIGAEICRQVLKLKPAVMVLYEISEYLLFTIERELKALNVDGEVDIRAWVGDVTNEGKLRSAIRSVNGCDLIYHAAAFKHVDMMERNPDACFFNNVIGTEIAALVAEEEGVEEFVLISTDKAVRPASVMGASKRLAERVVIERSNNGTSFKAVRFGNVLGSSGSVVPIFEQQIKDGGPVTVTSKDATRFFMTIPEAVELVIVAGALSEDRSICILEMGEPVKIDDLARRMIEFSGFVPDVDIMVEYIGLKPGEKEFEELFTDDEGIARTEHDQIWVVNKNDRANAAEKLDIEELRELIDCGNSEALKKFVHSRIPGSLLLED